MKWCKIQLFDRNWWNQRDKDVGIVGKRRLHFVLVETGVLSPLSFLELLLPLFPMIHLSLTFSLSPSFFYFFFTFFASIFSSFFFLFFFSSFTRSPLLSPISSSPQFPLPLKILIISPLSLPIPTTFPLPASLFFNLFCKYLYELLLAVRNTHT